VSEEQGVHQKLKQNSPQRTQRTQREEFKRRRNDEEAFSRDPACHGVVLTKPEERNGEETAKKRTEGRDKRKRRAEKKQKKRITGLK
jgi:hypothetical protein